MLDSVIEHAAGELLAAKRGEKETIVMRLAEQLGVSRATAYGRLRPILQQFKPRKRRSDFRASDVTRDELMMISAVLAESRRKNGKRLGDIETVLEVLRANDEIVAGRVNLATGEFRPYSASHIGRLLRREGLHPDSLAQPSPKVELASEHPNHIWQIDPSLCVLYWLRGNDGLQVMPQDEFYKNKPKNLARIADERIWRYVVVDHTSGAFYLAYMLHAETSENLCSCFINAMQYRGPDDPFHGVPRMVMMDPGSANLGAMFRNLCDALTVRQWVNQPKQPWSKGSVEKHNDIVERKFEWGLKFRDIRDLDALNAAAWKWMRDFQARRRHSRHGMTRYAAWMRINAAQLVQAPTTARCHEFANSAPQERGVDVRLRVRFRGHRYDVSGVPGVAVGGKLRMARNAFGAADSAQALGHDESGEPIWCRLEALDKNVWGFTNAAVPAGTYRSPVGTQIERNRKEVERLVMDAATDREAADKRKVKTLPFGGRLDPYKSVTTAPAIAHLPRAGTPAEVAAPRTIDAPPMTLPTNPEREFARLNPAEAARALKPLVERHGGHWSAALYAGIAERWPGGLPVDQVETYADELARHTRLRAVGGEA